MDSFPSKPEGRPPYQQYDWRGDWLLALVVLTGIALLIGSYAGVLNTLFYQTYSPFFDSASYASYVASVVGLVETEGTAKALGYALNGSTTPLPGLESVVLAKLGIVGSPVDRHYGIKLQLIWLWALALALYFYWFGFRRIGAWPAVALTLPFIMFTGLWGYNGGLSDFRMDLMLYIFFSLTVVLYLMTEETDSYGMWIAMGFAAALACLSRATAPVYLLVALGPPFAIRLWFAGNRVRLLKQALAMLVPVFALAISYFIYNFDALYYYYVVWSADANANLPWERSQRHFRFAFEAMGMALLSTGLFYGASVIVENLAELRKRGLVRALASVDWKLLYIGFAPALFLALRGAGWNPFVSMPSVFGWLMFLLAPLKRSPPTLRTPLTALALATVTLACGWNALQAPLRQQPDWPARMSAIREGIDIMRADAAAKGNKDIRFTTIHLWFYHSAFVRDALIHEYKGRAHPVWVTLPDGVRFRAYREDKFAAATKLDWQQLPGTTDAEKTEYLLNEARTNVDYIFMPDDRTVDNAEREISHNYANIVLRSVKKRFLESGDWTPLGGMLTISTGETVQVYTRKK